MSNDSLHASLYDCSSSECSGSSKGSNNRRIYKSVKTDAKSTKEYAEFRQRNNIAVKKHRSNSKKVATAPEDKIACYRSLAELYETQERRVSQSRKELEDLLQRYVKSEDVKSSVHTLIANERAAQANFQDQVAAVAQASEHGSQTS